MPTCTTSAGGSSAGSRQAVNSDVPGGVFSCQGSSFVPATDRVLAHVLLLSDASTKCGRRPSQPLRLRSRRPGARSPRRSQPPCTISHGRAAGGGLERDLHVRRVGGILPEMPAVGEAARWIPARDLAPYVLIAGARALDDAAARARLEHHLEPGVARDRVPLGPPQRGPARPDLEGVLRRAGDREAHLDRLHQRSPGAAGAVFSAARRKRAAASPHTPSRYSRNAAKPSSSRR